MSPKNEVLASSNLENPLQKLISTLSPAFEDRIIAIHGQKGKNWLESIPELLKKFLQRWSLSKISPIQNISYNFLVFATTSKNRPVVLKLGVPHHELELEIQALKAFNGDGTVQLIKADPSQGALLLERILPGNNLLSVEDDREATRIAARLMKKIQIPASNNMLFPTAGDWCQGFQRYRDQHSGTGPLPDDLVLNAADLANELLKSPQMTLLHGDLHHMNILLGEKENWIAIDPKGVIGEEAFEVGALLLNPVPDLVHWPDLKAVQKKRLMILAEELNHEQDRLTAWCYVRAVLSAIWSVEDGGDSNYGVKVALILRDLL